MELNELNYATQAFSNDSVDNEKSNQIEFKSKSLKIPPLSELDRKLEIQSIQKNLFLVAISGLLITTPMSGLGASTTSLLDDEGLGITSLAACSVTQFIGASFLLVYFNKIWGVRKMVTVTLILPVPFILSYTYPHWGTTFPASILLGLGQAFLTSMFMYGNALGYYYTKLINGNKDTVLIAISGLLSSCIGGGTFFGNVILFAVFNIGLQEDNMTLSTSVSYDVCGANYCNEELTNMPTMKKPESWRYYTVVFIFTVMATLGVILSLFIRDFSVELGDIRRKKSEYFSIMKETLRLLRRPRGFLLVGHTMFIGLEGAFMMAEYTLAYISCSIGIPKVGLIMLCYGGVHTIVCMSQGLWVKLFGRMPVIVFGSCLLLSCCLAVFLWHPHANEFEVFFILAVLWAIGDAIIIPTFFAMYAILFEDDLEGSLSLATFWWAFGFMVAFIWSQFLCVYVKLAITIATGCLGLFCYLILEFILWKNSKKSEVQVMDKMVDKVTKNG